MRLIPETIVTESKIVNVYEVLHVLQWEKLLACMYLLRSNSQVNGIIREAP